MAMLASDLSLPMLTALIGILAVSALVSGLSGFGFAAVGASSLWILPTTEAVPLLMALGLANQCFSIGHLRRDLLPFKDWWRDGPAPYLLGGCVGAPLGLAVLNALPTAPLIVIIGFLLVAYAGYSLVRPHRGGTPRRSPWPASVLIGVLGGLIGGFTAFPTAPIVIWLSCNHTPKSMTRAIIQPYIIGLQLLSLTLIAVAFPQTFTPRFFELLGLMLVFVLPGTLLGVFLYRKLSDVNFRRIAYILLGISGSSLLAKSIGTVPLAALLLLVHPAVTRTAAAQSLERLPPVAISPVALVNRPASTTILCSARPSICGR